MITKLPRDHFMLRISKKHPDTVDRFLELRKSLKLVKREQERLKNELTAFMATSDWLINANSSDSSDEETQDLKFIKKVYSYVS